MYLYLTCRILYDSIPVITNTKGYRMNDIDIDIDFPKMVRKFKTFEDYYTFEFNGLNVFEAPLEYRDAFFSVLNGGVDYSPISSLKKSLKSNLRELSQDDQLDRYALGEHFEQKLVKHEINSHVKINETNFIHEHEYEISKTNINKESYLKESYRILFKVGDGFTNIFFTYNGEELLIYDSENLRVGCNLLFVLVCFFVESLKHRIERIKDEEQNRKAILAPRKVEKMIDSIISHGVENEAG